MNYNENLFKPLTVLSHRSTPSSLLYFLAAALCPYTPACIPANIQLGLITVVILVRAALFPNQSASL